FMEERGHAIVPSSALVPENDPTTLFTGSGMQSMLPYLLGETHPKGVRVVDSQKCFRAEDIEEVGDNRHTTFFEMLGNWSFGDYFKEEQVTWMFEFLVNDLKIDPSRLYITAFGGDEQNSLPKDDVAPQLWQKLFAEKNILAGLAFVGSEADGYSRGMNDGERIFYYDASKNWWSRAGVPNNMPTGEPGGPDSEMFYDFGTPHDTDFGEHCHPNCDCGRFMEIGNNVFMQYVKKGENTFEELENKNIDFGGGLERIIAAVNNDPDVFKTDLLWNVIEQIQELSNKQYDENLEAFRVITDHIRGAVFMIGDGVLPGNTEQGYFVRRLLRRSVRYADVLGISEGELKNLAESVIESYKTHYTNLADCKSRIIDAIAAEETQFRKTLEKGLKQFNKIGLQIHLTSEDIKNVKETGDGVHAVTKKSITAQNAFDLFTTYGFPIELTEEIAEEKGLVVDRKGFETLMVAHREQSRAGADHKFKGGLADQSDTVVQYHTVTHLMLAGLRKELGVDVHQAGSNITGDRLRFDFTHPEKVEREILDKVEEFVNRAIQTGGDVTTKMMERDTAHTDPTIEGSFWDRYPDEVKVYSIIGSDNTVFSRELCGGPHVSKLADIHGTFRITKEESSSAGVRRIKAILE
ncbi:MAG: alanyl-tRNA synthetase, partial [Candidatus Azotimanducaceae bacterium]